MVTLTKANIRYDTAPLEEMTAPEWVCAVAYNTI